MNTGFVGVGRMGANMARRLKDRNFHVTAVYDTNRKVATDLAGELGCAACQDLAEVTAQSDVIFPVVTGGKSESTGQHGDEHQHRRPCRRTRAGRRAWT